MNLVELSEQSVKLRGPKPSPIRSYSGRNLTARLVGTRGGGGVFSDSSGIRAKIGDSSGIRNGDVRNDFSDEMSSLRAIEANFPL